MTRKVFVFRWKMMCIIECDVVLTFGIKSGWLVFRLVCKSSFENGFLKLKWVIYKCFTNLFSMVVKSVFLVKIR